MDSNLINYVEAELNKRGVTSVPNLDLFELNSIAEKVIGLYLSRIGKTFEEWIAEYVSSQCNSFIGILTDELKAGAEPIRQLEILVKTVPSAKADTVSLSPGATGALVALINQIVAELGKKKGKELLDGIALYAGRNHKISAKQLQIVADFIEKVNLKNRTALDMLVKMGILEDVT